MKLTHVFLHFTLAYSVCIPDSPSGNKQALSPQGGGVAIVNGGSSSSPMGGAQPTSVSSAPSASSSATPSGDDQGSSQGGSTQSGGTQTGGTTGGNQGATNGTSDTQSGGDRIAGGQLASNELPAGQSSTGDSSTGGGSTSSGSTGGGMKASFTNYGGCNTASAACGWYSNPGYNAAISQAVFGTGTGGGPGAACGQCYQLNPEGGSAKSIVVKVNNLCPVDGNPLCAYSADVDVNFDLCEDDGAADALFNGGPRQVNGTATQVDCGLWTGSGNLT